MNFLKLLAASAAVAVIVIAFRDGEGGWLAPAGLEAIDVDEEEPILGYDGMDTDALLDWLSDAGLDPYTLRRMREYERSHLGRETILVAIEERL